MISPFDVSGQVAGLFLIRKGLHDVADRIQLAPSQLLALRPVDDDVPDMGGWRRSPPTALLQNGRLNILLGPVAFSLGAARGGSGD